MVSVAARKGTEFSLSDMGYRLPRKGGKENFGDEEPNR